MKKTSKVATLLAMGALFLGGMLVSCNGVLDEAGTLNPSDPKKYANGTEVKTAEEIAKEAEEKKKNSSYTGPGSTDSWNFASQADTVDWVAKFKTNTITKDTDGTRSLDKSGNIDIAGASGSLTATILKDLAFKYGSSNSDPTYAYADPAIGFRIKSTGIKIANVKGKTQVKVEWVAMSSTRSLELYKGTDKKLISKEATGTGTAHTVTGTNTQAFDQEAITYTEDFGPGADLYLVATNNVFIKSITLTDKQGAAANPITALAITGTGVTNNAITLKTGLTVQLTRTATPADCDDSSVTWSSTNESVATVDTTGKVTAKAVGEAVIKATSTAVPTVVSNGITVTVPAIPRTVGKYFNVTAPSEDSTELISSGSLSTTDTTLSECLTPTTTNQPTDTSLATFSNMTVTLGERMTVGSCKIKNSGVGVEFKTDATNVTPDETFLTLTFTVTPATGKTVKVVGFGGNLQSGKGGTATAGGLTTSPSAKPYYRVSVGTSDVMYQVVPKNPGDASVIFANPTSITTTTTVKVEFADHEAKNAISIDLLNLFINVEEAN